MAGSSIPPLSLPTPPDSRPLSPHGKKDSKQYLEQAEVAIPLSLTSRDDGSAPTVDGPPTPTTAEPVFTPTETAKKYLVVSPYTDEDHLLDLNSVSLPNQLLAQALTSMDKIRDDFATAPYIDSFNWQVVVENLQSLLAADPSFHWAEQSFYIVVFRSQIPPTTDRSHLGQLDKVAHAEATASGGLLKYWFGTPDATGRNLATCVWRNIADAKAGGVGPGHREAGRQARLLYTEWVIERLRFVIGEGAKEWQIVPWTN